MHKKPTRWQSVFDSSSVWILLKDWLVGISNYSNEEICHNSVCRIQGVKHSHPQLKQKTIQKITLAFLTNAELHTDIHTIQSTLLINVYYQIY